MLTPEHVEAPDPDPRIQHGAASLSAAAAIASQALAADFDAARLSSYRTLRDALAEMLVDFHNRSGAMPTPAALTSATRTPAAGSLPGARQSGGGGGGGGGGRSGSPADLLPPLELAVAVLAPLQPCNPAALQPYFHGSTLLRPN